MEIQRYLTRACTLLSLAGDPVEHSGCHACHKEHNTHESFSNLMQSAKWSVRLGLPSYSLEVSVYMERLVDLFPINLLKRGFIVFADGSDGNVIRLIWIITQCNM